MDRQRLQLDKVLALLQQAGAPLPSGKAMDDTDFVQGLLDALCELSSRDALTGLVNRRAFMHALGQELDRVARAGDPALLLMVDIDHFKRVNDTHGHLAGDAVIRAVSQVLLDCVRPMDTVARIGGEEFAVIFPSCAPAFSDVVAERIRARVEALQVPFQDAGALRVTVSCGGAYAPAWDREPADAWIHRADSELYRAKAEGRNCVRIEGVLDSTVSADEKTLLVAAIAATQYPEPHA